MLLGGPCAPRARQGVDVDLASASACVGPGNDRMRWRCGLPIRLRCFGSLARRATHAWFRASAVQELCERCLVPFSCKSRALCPSCAGQRMPAQAAHLVDAVVPSVPLRHYVLSFPFELSLLAATNPKVLRALARINHEVSARYFQRRAAESSADGKTHAGALAFVHGFGSSLNLQLHLHLRVRVFDGVFVERDNEAPRLSPAQALSREGFCELLERFALRVARWLRKHGFAGDEQDLDSNETRVFTFDEMLARVAAGRWTFEKVKNSVLFGQAHQPGSRRVGEPRCACGPIRLRTARGCAVDDRCYECEIWW